VIREIVPQRRFTLADLVVLLLIGSAIAGLVGFGREWRSDFHPVTEIDLSFHRLPIYAFFSAVRGLAAYVISLVFTLVVGYWAAKSPRAERIILPLLDVLQSIPVLGFLPGLVLGLIALFPRTNAGLELSAILMIFTGQVWNMTFSYYSSLKSIPTELREAASVMRLTPWRTLQRLELPYSAVNLAWNSLMSMAGGWFFLSVCEAFALGDREFRLPGIGAYMAVAISRGDSRAMVFGIMAMVALIVFMDVLIWRPALAWAHRFRLEEVPGTAAGDPFVRMMLRESRVFWLLRVLYRYLHRRYHVGRRSRAILALLPSKPASPNGAHASRGIWKGVEAALGAATLGAIALGTWKLYSVLALVHLSTWVLLLRNTFWTLCRVFVTLVLSTLWAVPVGIWIGTSRARARVAQPIIQVLASFPAPMLYPLALAAFFKLGMSFDVGSMFLMMLGVQWYVLFNVLAGAMRIPGELQLATALMRVRPWRRWMVLYVPSVFPALVTGWVTAAGGAWNASIVAEAISYRGESLSTAGLGASIGQAAFREDFPMLAASLVLMVVVVILLNRTIWGRIYHLAQTRFRLD